MPADVKIGARAGSTLGSWMLWPSVVPTLPTVITPPILSVAVVGVLGVYIGGTYANATGVNVQWNKNGVAISGATNATYNPILGDLGATLTVTETPYNANGNGTPQTTLGIVVTL